MGRPVPSAQQVSEGQADTERLGDCKNRCATALSTIAARPAERSGSRCPGPLLWTAFAGERIDRPTASHATSAESPLVHRKRETPKAATRKHGGLVGIHGL